MLFNMILNVNILFTFGGRFGGDSGLWGGPGLTGLGVSAVALVGACNIANGSLPKSSLPAC